MRHVVKLWAELTLPAYVEDEKNKLHHLKELRGPVSNSFKIPSQILTLSPLVSSSAPRILQEPLKCLVEVQVNSTHCSPVPAEMAMTLWHCPFQCPLAALPVVLSPGFVTEAMWKDSNAIGLLVQLIQPWGLDWIAMPRDSSKVNLVWKYSCKIIISIEKGFMY